jgi:pimeloyl-ACP methyl ester carboxylesterase
MKWYRLYLISLLSSFAIASSAQYEVGHTSLLFYDEVRDRDVTAEVYYPADVAADDVELSLGEFPLVVFGHGFLMPWSDYSNIWNFLVPEGYIMAFVTTETGFPDHAAYGEDLLFILNSMVAENTVETSLFYNHLNGREGIMGHSMGGGATWLAASAASVGLETIVGLAPAETTPSAIEAAQSVDVPVLVISGDADGVTPPNDHHLPIYDNTASECKAFVSILEGGHCGYADDGTICDLGEFLFDGMSREEQQSITHTLLLYWLGYYLKNQEDGSLAFEAYCNDSEVLTLTTNCNFSLIPASNLEEFSIYPNPTSKEVFLSGLSSRKIAITNAQGQVVLEFLNNSNIQSIDVSGLERGLYYISLDDGRIVRKLILIE